MISHRSPLSFQLFAAVPLGPQELAHFLLKVRRKSVPKEAEVSKLLLSEGSGLSPCEDFLPSDGAQESLAALHATFIVMWRVSIVWNKCQMLISITKWYELVSNY